MNRRGAWPPPRALLLTLVPALQPPRRRAAARTTPDDRFAGLQWRFVRIKYHYVTEGDARCQQDFYGEPWGIDAPAAEQNLSRRVKTATVDPGRGSRSC